MRLTGRLTKRGDIYEDKSEAYEFRFHENCWNDIPFRFGERVPVSIEIVSQRFEGGIRTVPKVRPSSGRPEYVYICPDLVNEHGKFHLGKELQRVGVVSDGEFEIEGSDLVLIK
jgi:hypothetical protein